MGFWRSVKSWFGGGGKTKAPKLKARQTIKHSLPKPIIGEEFSRAARIAINDMHASKERERQSKNIQEAFKVSEPSKNQSAKKAEPPKPKSRAMASVSKEPATKAKDDTPKVKLKALATLPQKQKSEESNEAKKASLAKANTDAANESGKARTNYYKERESQVKAYKNKNTVKPEKWKPMELEEAKKKAAENAGKDPAWYALLNESEQKLLRSAREKRELNKIAQEEFHEMTDHKYDVEYWEKLGNEEEAYNAKIRKRNGEDAADPAAEIISAKYSPKLYSATRGALNGVTAGGSDFILSRRKGEQGEAEKYYQENKSKGWETAGDIGGSILMFAVTGGGSKEAVKKGAEKIFGKEGFSRGVTAMTEWLSKNPAIRKAAIKEAEYAAKKGLINLADDAVRNKYIQEFAAKRAGQLLAEAGTDASINLTTGALRDFMDASKDHKIGSTEWLKSFGTNAALNWGLGAVPTVAPALRVKRIPFLGGVRKETREVIADVAARDAREAATQEFNALRRGLAGSGKVEPPRFGESIEDRIARLSGNAENPRGVVEIGAGDNGIDVINPNRPRSRDVEIGADESGIDVINPNARRRGNGIVEIGAENGGVDVINPNARVRGRESIEDALINEPRAAQSVEPPKQTIEDTLINEPKAEVEAPKADAEAKPSKRKPSKNEKLRDELRAEREALQSEYEAAKEAGEDVTDILTDMQEADLMIKDLDRKIAKAEKAREARLQKAVKQEPPKARVEEPAVRVEEPAVSAHEPTLREKAIKAENRVEQALNADQVERMRNSNEIKRKFRDYNAELREASNGKFGLRKGIVSRGKGAPPKEQRRLIGEMIQDVDRFIEGNIDSADTSEIAYNTWNQFRKEQKLWDSYRRASDDVNSIAENLTNKLKKFLNDPERGTDLKIEDVMDMIAVERVYRDSGLQMPDDLVETFSRLIIANKTEHAQGLAVVEQILRQFSPSYRKAYITKDFDKFLSRFGNADWDEVAAALDRRYGTKGYLDAKLNELINFEGDAKEFKELYKQLQRDVLRNSKPTLWNILDSLRHTFMLGNLATAGRNIIGNTSQRLMYDVADKINEGFEAIIAHKIKVDPEFAAKYSGFERTTKGLKFGSDNRKLMREITKGKLGKLLSKSSGYLDGVKDKEYAQFFRNLVDEDVEEIMGYEKLLPQLEKGSEYKPKNAIEAVGKGVYKVGQGGGKVVSFLLNEPDSWFVERNYRSALARYLEANGITDSASLAGKDELIARAREHAKDVALENTYKKANRLTTLIERGRAAGKKRGANPLAKLGSVVLDAELPYAKVPINMVRQNIKYSPTGIFETGWNAYKAMRYGDVRSLQKASAELSKVLTGSAIAALGFYLHCDESEQMDEDSVGIIHNAADYLKQYGVRDNSLKVGDKNYNIADIGLAATQLVMGAAYADALNESGGAPSSVLDDVDAVLQVFKAPLDTEADMSLLDNFMQFWDALSANGDYDTKPTDRIENALSMVLPGYANQFLPNPMRAAAKGFTEYDLDTGVKKGKGTTRLEKTLKRNVNNFVQGIPKLNEKALPHKVDVHGNAVSTGLYPEGRDTTAKKITQSLVNFADPLSTRKINIPEADKVELKVKDEDGKPYIPKGFDENRTYKAKIGKGDTKEEFDLTGKQREQAARSVKTSGKEMARALVNSKKGWFGDSHGQRAQEVLAKCPEDEEKAREYLYSLPEFKNLDDEGKRAFMDTLYYGDGNSGGKNYGGRERVSNKEVYVNIQGHTEDEFRFVNDLTNKQQANYLDNELESRGVSKAEYCDAIEAIHYAEHEYKNGENVDTINGKTNIVSGILSLGLSPEQNIAIYEAVKGNRNWKPWDGVSGVSSGYRRRRYGGYRRRGGGSSRKAKVPALKQSAFKASTAGTKSAASTLKVRSRSNVSLESPIKIEPPKVKFKEYNV